MSINIWNGRVTCPIVDRSHWQWYHLPFMCYKISYYWVGSTGFCAFCHGIVYPLLSIGCSNIFKQICCSAARQLSTTSSDTGSWLWIYSIVCKFFCEFLVITRGGHAVELNLCNHNNKKSDLFPWKKGNKKKRAHSNVIVLHFFGIRIRFRFFTLDSIETVELTIECPKFWLTFFMSRNW